MSTTVDDKVVRWLTKLLSCATENGRVCRVELVHPAEGEMPDKCIALGIDEGQDVGELAQELWDAADRDAGTRNVGTLQRYVIRLFDTPSGDDHIASYPFTLRGTAAGPYTGSDSEPANEKGITAQLMRTVENQNRLLVHNAAAVSDELARAIQRARVAEDRELKTRKLHEDMLDRSVERELEKAKGLMRAKRTDEFIGTILPFVPLLLTKFLQGAALAAGAVPAAALPSGATTTQTPRDSATEAFVKSLSMTEMQGVMGALKGANQITMMEIFKLYQSPATPQTSQARDITIGKLLKGLSGEELQAVLRAFTDLNRELFVQIYDLYVTAHEEAQSEMPEILRDEVTESKETKESH